ncbi:uncharacterized protein LOC106055683 isoform X2 [Biomphalaria glabrata]|uniref:Uncharacterized protein LOC106055683 isoform X2 n=1 Tax=Biomphalaria glabrata TaxID=6526 RepID=A0A9U8E0G0_BIOGL|nr:uncharacterized protein LOC106055683 isoform X2 [Biomphalaria glabrata]
MLDTNVHSHLKDEMPPSRSEANTDIVTEDSNSYLLIINNTLSDQRTSMNQKKLYEDNLSEELQHASELSTSLESDETHRDLQVSGKCSRSSSIRVEIQDLCNDGSFNFTTNTLRKCKQLVLRPYWGLLLFIGWRGFHRESIDASKRRWRCINFMYPAVIVLLLLYTYMYEILACEWKLDIKTDSKFMEPTSSTPVTTRTTKNHSHITAPMSFIQSAHPLGNNLSSLSISQNIGCQHIVTTYFIPNLLHFLAYCLGLYYFRIQENEQLYALMEKVFLQATPLQARTASQQKMIYKLRLFLILGAIWVFFTVLLQCLYVWAFNFPKLPLFETIGESGYWVLFSVELMGRTVFNSVILAIVMNYATQCEMIKFYVRGLGLRLQEKSTDLKTAMKDLLMLRQSLSLLNGIISKMTSLAAIILAELTIIGVCILFLNEYDDAKVWTYRSFFPVIWALMLCFPLVQAARVNSICLRIQKISLEMRVFGYKGASILDLDSFLQFVSLTKLKAKLFHVPMLPSHLIFTAIATSFILLILVQTSSIGLSNYYF